jgi:sensor domain CHASE-containing protein
MFELICIGFIVLFLGVLAVCCVMGATKLKREQEELEYQQRLNERMKDILEGEPT